MKTTKKDNLLFLKVGALLLWISMALQAQPCCPDTGGVKYVQPPNLVNGIDVISTYSPTDPQGLQYWVLADDFPCTNSGPVTDIHLWGSWYHDRVDPNAAFSLGIWSDVPTNSVNGSSHPGNLLWSQTYTNGQYSYCIYTNKVENFVEEESGFGIVYNDDTTSNLYYLCFDVPPPFNPTNTFFQTGTAAAKTNYWLSVTVQASSTNYFGWKSSSVAYNDNAVVADSGSLYPQSGDWGPMFDASFNSLNMAFKVNTATTSNPPPVVCVETNGVKYVQWPQTNYGGLDVWNSSSRPSQVSDGPFVLADDFVCTNNGPITDVHLWGSWLNDQYATNAITFWLGIYDDVPATNGCSHPGNLLVQQTFAPGQYAEEIWSSGQEFFFDPTTNQSSACQGNGIGIGSDTVVWYYCFYPTNWFQSGSVTNAKTYWLAAFAQLPAGMTNAFGWKTTTNVLHDVSVHALWPGNLPNNATWIPTYDPNLPVYGPVDLAFKLNTATNSPPPASPPLSITHSGGGQATISYPYSGANFNFQQATNVIGPWSIYTNGYLYTCNAVQYLIVPITPPHAFYRLKYP